MATSPYVIDYEGSFHLDLPPDQVWAIISHTDRFEDWWGWLREFETEGRDLATGSVLRGVVVPPLPYRMRLEVLLVKSAKPRRIDAVVSGDLRGTATLTFTPDGDGTEASVSWTIEMMQRTMRVAARLAHPLLRWGHDLVVQATVDNFRRLLATKAGSADSEGSSGSADSAGFEVSGSDEPGPS